MTRPLDVSLITSGKFGLTQFVFRDIDALVRKGHRVRLFMLIRKPGLYDPLPDWEVSEPSAIGAILALFRLGVRRPMFAWRLVRHALKFKGLRALAVAAHWAPTMAGSDLLFSYFGDYKLFVGYYAKRITGLPLVVTIRAYELYRNPNDRLFKEALGLCDEVLTITEYNKTQLVERFGVPAEKIEIVRQIVDLDEYSPQPRTRILTVGFFAEKKGYDVLLRALQSLGRDDIELWIVGDWTPTVLPVDVRKMAVELEIEDRVAFFGAQSGVALRALFHACDIFCLPSRTDNRGDKEGFPNVIAEAMASGKPVVATRHAGIPEAIDSILVDENDVEQLAEALDRAAASPELRARLGSENRTRAEAMFSPANNDSLIALLHDVIMQSRLEGLDR